MNKQYKFSGFLVLLLLTALSRQGYAQTFKPIFEDADGRTSIIAPLGYLGINTENSSIQFQYFMSKSAGADPDDALLLKRNRFYWGVKVAGSAAGGVSTIFNYGNFTPGTSASLFLGHRSLLFQALDKNGEPVLYGSNQIAIEDWLTLRLGGEIANYTLYDAARPFDEQIYSEQFRGHIAQLTYNVLIGGATSVGVSWDVSKVNNIDALSPVKFTQQTILPGPSGQTTRIFEREVNAFSGAYQTSIVNTYGVDAVRYVTPASELNYAFHVFGRLKHTTDIKPVYEAGAGFYLFPKGKVAGGVFLQTSDLTNAVSETPDFAKRLDLGLTVKLLLPGLGVPNP
ncbi:hypothetical protein I2I11_15520 [Pontibacter sp. 172403-2]|uniref:hypothetical protein n=1 Tax=Pontibacter rufus TaxID=2791028 RepID=UPI0018AFD391|nr:hypothetical protein [Pontibacter sp. 172403-2]MBF9254714.1 hypothetical protein [Pontibacter sp. 172403-2]